MSIDNALCDLGASVSVNPLSLREKLGMGGLKSTNLDLKLVDSSFNYLVSVLEDFLMKVGHLFISIDFMVMEMYEDS